MYVEHICSSLVYFYTFSIGKPWRTKSCMYFNSLTLFTAIDLVVIRILLKWIIVCHDKISTRFKVVFQRHNIDDRSILSSLYSFFHSFHVYDYDSSFFFSFPKFLIKSVSDISGKNFLSKKNAFSFFIRKRISLFSFLFHFDITKIYSKKLLFIRFKKLN